MLGIAHINNPARMLKNDRIIPVPHPAPIAVDQFGPIRYSHQIV
jgi:hypothetical protein